MALRAAIFFAIPMGIIFSVQQGVIVGMTSGLISGGLFGLLIFAFANNPIIQKQLSVTPSQLLDDERILYL